MTLAELGHSTAGVGRCYYTLSFLTAARESEVSVSSSLMAEPSPKNSGRVFPGYVGRFQGTQRQVAESVALVTAPVLSISRHKSFLSRSSPSFTVQSSCVQLPTFDWSLSRRFCSRDLFLESELTVLMTSQLTRIFVLRMFVPEF